jgi:tripartite-type tricarboxylate transporter receptor subunit TctC
MSTRGWIRWLFAAPVVVLALAVAMANDQAQAGWPTKAIEVVMPLAAGGGGDTMARMIAKHMSSLLGKPMNISNKPGGNQIPGVLAVLQSPPDGYTLLADGLATSVLQGLLPNLPYKIEDRTFLNILAEGRSAFFVSGKSPYKTLKDAMDAAKKDPASFTWTYLGGTTVTDFAQMALFVAAGVDIAKTKPVPFAGAGPGMTAVAGGHVVFGAGGSASVIPLKSSGNLRVLAVNGDRRAKALADVPSAKEAGFDVGIQNFYSLAGPKGLPKEVVDKIDAAAKKISADPAFVKDVEGLASEVCYMSPAEYRQRVLKEIDQYRALQAKFPKL